MKVWIEYKQLRTASNYGGFGHHNTLLCFIKAEIILINWLHKLLKENTRLCSLLQFTTPYFMPLTYRHGYGGLSSRAWFWHRLWGWRGSGARNGSHWCWNLMRAWFQDSSNTTTAVFLRRQGCVAFRFGVCWTAQERICSNKNRRANFLHYFILI
jgi:hypothetical protein